MGWHELVIEGDDDESAELERSARAGAPVARFPRMMGQRENQDAIRLGPVNQGEWEVADNDSSCIGWSSGARLGKFKRESNRLLDGRREFLTPTGPCRAVVVDFREELKARRRHEASSLHRARRRASAKTSSAE